MIINALMIIYIVTTIPTMLQNNFPSVSEIGVEISNKYGERYPAPLEFAMKLNISHPRAGNTVLNGMIVISLVSVVVAFCIVPQWFRTPLQPPVSVEITTNFLGFANGIKITNNSSGALKSIRVIGKNTSNNTSQEHYIEALSSHQSIIVSFSEWRWSVAPNEWVIISTVPYLLPTTFTAEQLGIK
jgi:hypothetical protein